ncbi:sensor histidine kinase [Psychrobacter glacincola]|uniref:Sensor histidine kinase n=1 Tax=Psychrobacter glacincola TaxID=56810 RepID=A0ABW1W4S1_9GAMM|nr:sensor histidine kinase [Psychrobacter glacincola]
MKNWRSYRSKTSQENKNSSIANDEVALLAERLEFFIPKLMEIMKPWQWLLSIFFWSLFLAIVDRYSVTNETQFVIKIIARFIQTTLTLLSSFYLIDYLRPVFKRMRTLRVSLYILLIITINAVVTLTLVLLLMMNTGAFTFTLYAFTSTIVFNTLIIAGFTIAGLLIFLRRYREMTALKQSFEKKLAAQNDVLKARLAPHFFFNTINTLMSLIETNPSRAADLLQHVSALFRASFNGVREISFQEEVALCEHYLAIEMIRLADKLVVSWQLPDENVMYDMVITALSLQSVIEKMLLNVVERSTETVYIDIKVTWLQDRVVITISAQLPKNSLMIYHDLRQHMDFYSQAERLRAYFGQSSDIQSRVTNKQIITIIDYPLQDVGL